MLSFNDIYSLLSIAPDINMDAGGRNIYTLFEILN